MPTSLAKLSPDIFDKYAAELENFDNLVLICLRGHALIELTLRELLTTRLAVDATSVGSLNFARLADLALAGFPESLSGAVSHINRVRNYAAHHIDASDFEQKIEEFFRERGLFQIQWHRDGTHKAKCLLWCHTLRGVATIITVAAQGLRIFREAQLDTTEEALGYDEPKAVREIGDAILVELFMPPFGALIDIYEEKAAMARSSAHSTAGVKPSRTG
jgi:hypothetical protein